MSHPRTTARVLTLAAFAGLSIPGAAAGGILDPAPAYPVAPRYAPPVHDWTGFYVGLSGGASWGSANWQSDPYLTTGTVSGSTGLIGGTIGYNSQNLGPLVVGEEFDFSWRAFNFTLPAPVCGPTCSLTSDWVSTARLRLGYPISGFLPYVTGGLSMSNFVASAADSSLTSNNVTFSWTAGAGVEFVISGPWSGKVEYLYMNHTGFSCNECTVSNTAPVTLKVDENIFRAGFNYRPGGW